MRRNLGDGWQNQPCQDVDRYKSCDIISSMKPDMIGYIAATLTTVSFVPQVIKTWKSKHANDVSLLMYCIFTAGIIMWLIYGIWAQAWPVAAANAVTLVLAGLILIMKLKWG